MHLDQTTRSFASLRKGIRTLKCPSKITRPLLNTRTHILRSDSLVKRSNSFHHHSATYLSGLSALSVRSDRKLSRFPESSNS